MENFRNMNNMDEIMGVANEVFDTLLESDDTSFTEEDRKSFVIGFSMATFNMFEALKEDVGYDDEDDEVYVPVVDGGYLN